MSSSMLGVDSEISAMSEDISLASSISITPAKRASAQNKQGMFYGKSQLPQPSKFLNFV